MAAGNEFVNGNDFGFALVITGAAFDNVHAGCWIWETERCKPFDVYEWTGNVQSELRRKVENDANLSGT